MKRYKYVIVVFVLSIFFYFPAQKVQGESVECPKNGFGDLVEKLLPTVVNITTKQKIAYESAIEKGWPALPEGFPFEEFDNFFDRFGWPYESEKYKNFSMRKAVSVGSGFIISSDGYIVTNYHVIRDAEIINVKLNDGSESKAKIIGTDPKTDLALIKINLPKSLACTNFGESEKVRVGDWAIAIGNPYGLGGTVTSGIISAHARNFHFGGIIDEFIQTDAPLNRGSSGGPLFNINGEVIGITTAIASNSFMGGNIGIGFAIPSSIAIPIIENLKNGIKIVRGYIGVKVQDLTEEIAESLGLKDSNGALVVDINKDGPAAKAGLKVGDIILEFNHKKILNSAKLSRLISEAHPNKQYECKIIDKQGNKKILNIIVGQYKDSIEDEKLNNIYEDDDKGLSKTEKTTNIQGATISKLTPELRTQYNINKDIKGVLVLKVDKHSEFASLGIKKGDVIVEANQQPLNSPKDLEKIINAQQHKSRKYLSLLINRDGQTIFTALSIYKK